MRAAEEPAALRGVGEELDRLHRHEAQVEWRRDGEVPGVGVLGGHRQAAARRALGERREQPGVVIQGGDRRPTGGEVEGDPAGAGPHVEHGAGVAIGEAAPEHEVVAVAPAFEVMPDDRRVGSGAHPPLQNASPWPRRVSSARSSRRAG